MKHEIKLREFDFESKNYQILPGTAQYYCAKHDKSIRLNIAGEDSVSRGNNAFSRDIDVLENRCFRYQILTPQDAKRTNKITFMFHGFNEKDWTKYLPWAETICQKTGSSVVLFPIAFHMQRAPKRWSNPRDMYAQCKQRKILYPKVESSSFSNVAISLRIHNLPNRFIWSGLQSYYDVLQLVEECKSGLHPYIDKDFKADFFAYSIGGFLALTLKLCNFEGYFSDSKVCLFCSGAALRDLAPVSKFILDSEAYAALYSYIITNFEQNRRKDELVSHYLGGEHPEGQILYSLFDVANLQKTREDLLKLYQHQIFAIGLTKDTVIAPRGISRLLKGEHRDISIPVHELDFDRIYSHEDPFSISLLSCEETKKDFDSVFSLVCSFFTGS